MAKEKPKAKKNDKADKDEGKKNSKSKVAAKVKAKKPKQDTPKAKSTKRKKKIGPDERIEMIRTAAYYLAEKRGHHGNFELDDWIAAEKEIDGKIK